MKILGSWKENKPVQISKIKVFINTTVITEALYYFIF